MGAALTGDVLPDEHRPTFVEIGEELVTEGSQFAKARHSKPCYVGLCDNGTEFTFLKGSCMERRQQ